MLPAGFRRGTTFHTDSCSPSSPLIQVRQGYGFRYSLAVIQPVSTTNLLGILNPILQIYLDQSPLRLAGAVHTFRAGLASDQCLHQMLHGRARSDILHQQDVFPDDRFSPDRYQFDLARVFFLPVTRDDDELHAHR